MHIIDACSRNWKNYIGISVNKAIVKMLFGSITQELLGLPEFWCYFLVHWTIYYKMHILKDGISEIEQKHANLGLGGALPLKITLQKKTRFHFFEFCCILKK